MRGSGHSSRLPSKIGARIILSPLSRPLLHIHAAGHNFVVTDPGVPVYIGTRPERHGHRERLETIFVASPTPFGVLLQHNAEEIWEIQADGAHEGTIRALDGISHRLYSPHFTAGQAWLPEGFSLLLMGKEPIELFVPPRNPHVLKPNYAFSVRSQEQREIDEQNDSYLKKVEIASRPADAREVESHNTALRDELQGPRGAPGSVPMRMAGAFAFHPATGKLIAYQGDPAFERAIADGFPRAQILRNPSGPYYKFFGGEPSPEVRETLFKIHPFYGLR